jgi:hypothetical protein
MISEGDRFAVLCLNDVRVQVACSDNISLANGMKVTRSSPFEVTATWATWLGSLITEELQKSHLFLIASRQAEHKDVVDSVNAMVEEDCGLYLRCMQIAAPFSVAAQPRIVSGTWKSGGAPFRQISTERQPMHTPGAPLQAIDDALLQQAASLYISIHKKLGNPSAWGRVIWSVNCFFDACFSSHPFERIHNFVRALEGFLQPPRGNTKKAFKSRSELLVGPRDHRLMDLIYEVRSKIEHLNDPSEALADSDFTESEYGYHEIAWIVESIARHCLKTFFLSPRLEPHFETDNSISNFWKLPAAVRMELFGLPLKVTEVRSAFDLDLALSERS